MCFTHKRAGFCTAIVALSFAAAVTPASAATSSGVIKGEVDLSGQIHVTLLADGRPMRLLVDSGSSASILDSRAVKRLGLLLEPSKSTGGSKVNEVRGLGGTTEIVGKALVRELVVGKLKIEQVRFDVLDLTALFEDFDSQMMPAPDGLLGADFLNKFGVTVDFAAATLVAHRPESRTVTIRGRVLCVGEDQTPTLTLASMVGDQSSHLPVSSAVVTVRGDSLGNLTATSDATGAFEFRDLFVLKTELLFTGVEHQETGGLPSIPVFPGLISKQRNDWVFLLPFSTCPKASDAR